MLPKIKDKITVNGVVYDIKESSSGEYIEVAAFLNEKKITSVTRKKTDCINDVFDNTSENTMHQIIATIENDIRNGFNLCNP